jgi:hypothetical protein
MANGMREYSTNHTLPGTYLKDRRTKLDPAAFDFPPKRRRTPGLRREEVAQRANMLNRAAAARPRRTCSIGSRAL